MFLVQLLAVQSFLISRPASITSSPSTQQFMFGGSGAPTGETPEEAEQIEQAAKSMGMSVAEYRVGIQAREKLTSDLDAARVVAGSPDTVSLERDGHNPPRFFEISITEAGKAQGKEAVSKQLIEALKTGSVESRKARTDAQKNMMAYISEEMKKLGA